METSKTKTPDSVEEEYEEEYDSDREKTNRFDSFDRIHMKKKLMQRLIRYREKHLIPKSDDYFKFALEYLDSLNREYSDYVWVENWS